MQKTIDEQESKITNGNEDIFDRLFEPDRKQRQDLWLFIKLIALTIFVPFRSLPKVTVARTTHARRRTLTYIVRLCEVRENHYR